MRKGLLFLALAGLLVPATASADVTAFLGVTSQPTRRATRGLAAGVGLLVVGFEFEFASTEEDLAKAAPGLKTYMFNGVVQTPFPIGGMQFYGTAGGGFYRESVTVASQVTTDTHVGMNIGGGVKMSVLGPVRLRLDYRIFKRRGEPENSNVQRFYAGLNLKF